jgi:hypothetical protein
MTSSSLTRRRSERARKESCCRRDELRCAELFARGASLAKAFERAARMLVPVQSVIARAAQRRGCHRNDPVLASGAAKGRYQSCAQVSFTSSSSSW